MSSMLYSDYDVLAQIYVEMYSQPYDEDIMQLLEKLFLQHLPQPARILDLCCGSGDLTKPLLDCGYQVTGIDSSEAMLNYARTKAPDGKFVLGDARYYKFSPTFHGAIAAGDSLNHVMNIEGLKSVFKNVFAALLENGLFGFNMSMEEMYGSENWDRELQAGVTDNLVWVWKQSYEPEHKIGQRKITIMQLVDGNWQRLDRVLASKVYSPTEIISTLESTGFRGICYYDLERDLGISNSLGNAVFVCHK
jgi:SAM-dependent methyltransferase